MYDFTTLISRENTGSHKWDDVKAFDPSYSGIVPFSVADMEFATAPEIKEGLKEYIDGSILGYTGPTDAYYRSVIGWMERRHGYSPKREWFVEAPGIVPAIGEMVAAWTKPDDGVLITSPVYHPFRIVPEGMGRRVINSPLLRRGRTYDVDFEDFRRKAALKETKIFLLCSPHNPVGRVWSGEELKKMMDICLENSVFVIADEIHSDLIMPGYKHVSVGTMTDYLGNCAICTAPSKTFNLAGMQVSNIFIKNEERRNAVLKARGHSSLNALAYASAIAAYDRAGDWLDALISVLDENRRFVEGFAEKRLPGVSVAQLQATYLQWLDFGCMGLGDKELELFMKREAKMFFNEGAMFGPGGSGFERMNIACPKPVLCEALERLAAAFEKAGK